jgi:hypothetical protein
LRKKQILGTSIFLLAAAFWAVALLPIGLIHASMIIYGVTTSTGEQPAPEFRGETVSRAAPPIAGFDPVEINDASDFINHYFGGEGEAYQGG